MNLFQQLHQQRIQHTTRRHFLRDCGTGLGALWLAQNSFGASSYNLSHDNAAPLAPLPSAFNPKVKRIIYLHMIGAAEPVGAFRLQTASWIKLRRQGPCPRVVSGGEKIRLHPGHAQHARAAVYPFKQHGQSGAWVSDRMPHSCEGRGRGLLSSRRMQSPTSSTTAPPSSWFTPAMPSSAIPPSAPG